MKLRSPASAALLCAAALVGAGPLWAQAEGKPPAPATGAPRTAASQAAKARAAEDHRARVAFQKLGSKERQEVLDFLELEISHSGSFQSVLIAWTLKQQDRDPATWPAAEPPPIFDPVMHAPGQPIPRRLLDPGSAAAKRAVETILGGGDDQARDAPATALARAWVYDYGSRELRRLVTGEEKQRVFDNALLGHPPQIDLVEALIERMLDDGSQKSPAEAFSHAYADRAGGVFPGITLYDAYNSGTEIEMPDVETLGIVHLLFDDWSTWRAPIPASEHERLYERVGEQFSALRRHRTLRHAIALTFACGTRALRDGYQGNLDNFHALWEDCASTPETLRARLPGTDDWTAFLEGWVKRCLEPDSPYRAGQHRRAVLDGDAALVRATVFRVLEEYGALEPAKPAPAKPAGGQ